MAEDTTDALICATHSENSAARIACEALKEAKAARSLADKAQADLADLKSSFWGQLVEFGPELAALLALLILVGFLILLWRRGARVEEVSLDVAGSSVTFKTATDKINQLLEDVQTQVIEMTVPRGPGLLSQQKFNEPPPEPENRSGLSILWVTDDDEILIFEKSVLEKMGNTIDTSATNNEALVRFRNGETYDLVISDIYRPYSKLGGLHLFNALKTGVKSGVFHGDDPVAKIGPDMRFAIYSRPSHVAAIKDRFEGEEHALITSSFGHLVKRIDWLQRVKAANETPEKRALRARKASDLSRMKRLLRKTRRRVPRGF